MSTHNMFLQRTGELSQNYHQILLLNISSAIRVHVKSPHKGDSNKYSQCMFLRSNKNYPRIITKLSPNTPP